METESNATKITRLTLFLLPTILFSSINSYLVIYLRLNPWNGEDFREEIKINEPTGTYASSPLLIDIMGIEGYRINGILLDSSFVLSLDFDWNLNLILFKCELFFFHSGAPESHQFDWRTMQMYPPTSIRMRNSPSYKRDFYNSAITVAIKFYSTFFGSGAVGDVNKLF